MILTFNDYILDNQTTSQTTDIRYPTFKGYHNEIAPPLNYDVFYQKAGVCPFCKLDTELSFPDEEYMGNMAYQIMVYECLNCGWWQVAHDLLDKEIEFIETHTISRSIVYNAILKAFHPGDLNLPMQALIDEFQKRPEVLYQIHSTKMELLVKDILSDFFQSEVRHVGKTGDGGVDLLLINKDEPTLIQVKRRTKKESVETISTVRDLLGAMFINNSKKGMIVSTADHFTKIAIKTGEEEVKKGKLTSFDMIDFDNFCAMLNLVRKDQNPPWLALAEKRFK
jgi:restriction system protein